MNLPLLVRKTAVAVRYRLISDSHIQQFNTLLIIILYYYYPPSFVFTIFLSCAITVSWRNLCVFDIYHYK